MDSIVSVIFLSDYKEPLIKLIEDALKECSPKLNIKHYNLEEYNYEQLKV